MSTRTKSRSAFAVALVLPIVASVGFSTAAPSSGAVSGQLAANGGFEAGRNGWALTTPRTRLSVVQRGLGGSKAMMLIKRRPGGAGVTSRPGAVKSSAARQKYAVSAWVRTNQPGALGTLALRETVGGKVALETKRAFRASRAWQKVALTAVTRRSASQLEVRLQMNRLGKRKSILIDGVSVVRLTTTSGGTTSPRPSSATTPTPTPTPTRKLPLFGAAVGSNGSPAALEASAGRAFGIRRTYWAGSQVTSAIKTAAADIAAGRVPWISFKLPASWAAMASGSQDAWLRDLGTRLRALNGEVWVALHHEPENDGDIEEWKAMQRRAAPLVDGGDADVKFTIVFTGWHQFFSTSAAYKMAKVWPGDNTGVEVIGIDPYNEYGVTKTGAVNMKAGEFDNQKRYYDQLATFAKAHGTNWAVAETGFTDRAVADKGAGWLAKAYNDMANNPVLPGLAFAYFDSSLNPIGDATWAVENVPAKRAAFVAVLKRSLPTIN